MIETNQHTDASVESQPTPQTITTTMILNDLDNGVDRKGIQTKYSLEGWELTEMFKHPVLKGKKAKKKRKMSFNFVDDTAGDSAQITVQEVIDDVMGTVNTIADDFHNRADLRTQDAIENSTVVDTGETVLGYTAEQVEELNSEAYSNEISINNNTEEEEF